MRRLVNEDGWLVALFVRVHLIVDLIEQRVLDMADPQKAERVGGLWRVSIRWLC